MQIFRYYLFSFPLVLLCLGLEKFLSTFKNDSRQNYVRYVQTVDKFMLL